MLRSLSGNRGQIPKSETGVLSHIDVRGIVRLSTTQKATVPLLGFYPTTF